MLNALFGSEVRAKILNLLLLDSEKKYTLRQIAKEISATTAVLRKELLSLREFGLAKEDGELWSADQDFIIFPELRALVAKAQVLSSQKFLEGLKKISEPILLIMTGIFTGDALVKTDVLLVGPVKKRAMLKLVADLEKDLGREINFTIMDETEFYYRQEVMDIFLYNILAGKTIVLVDNRETNQNINFKKYENDSPESDN